MILHNTHRRLQNGSLFTMPWHQRLLNGVCQVFSTYQYWNAAYLHPQRYGQSAHGYASQQASRYADQCCCCRALDDQDRLDSLVDVLGALNQTEVDNLLVRLQAAGEPSCPAAITTMSDRELDALMVDVEAAAHRAHRC